MPDFIIGLMVFSIVLIGLGVLGLALVYRHERRIYMDHIFECELADALRP